MPTKQKQQTGRECAMNKSGLSYLARQNPCAQCGKPIAMPEWVESSERRTSYLWHCWACDYRFEAIAFEPEVVRQPIAA
jgi:ribosomal protein L37AE/L43A